LFLTRVFVCDTVIAEGENDMIYLCDDGTMRLELEDEHICGEDL